MSDSLARELSQKIPNDWQELGTILGLPDYTIDAIKVNEAGNVSHMAYSMFKKWKELSGKDATTLSLMEALKKCGREDLLSCVQSL